MSKEDVPETLDDDLEVFHAGIYRMFIEKKRAKRFQLRRETIQETWTRTVKNYRVVVRLFKEAVPLAPHLFFLWFLNSIWSSIQPVLLAMLENKVLRIIERGIATGSVDSRALVMTLAARIVFVTLSHLVATLAREHISSSLKECVRGHFDEIIYAAQLQMDLPAVQKNMSFKQLDPDIGYQVLQRMVSVIGTLISGLSHLALVLIVAQDSSGKQGILFALFCVVQPVLQGFQSSSIWSTPRVVEATNEHYLRKMSFKDLVDTKYRLDIISGNIVEYIIEQYKAATNALKTISTERPEFQYYWTSKGGESRSMDLIQGVLFSEITMISYAMMAIFNISEVSLAALATVQAATNSVQASYWRATYYFDLITTDVAKLEQIYEIRTLRNIVEDGSLAYPHKRSSEKGMSFEIRNVSFQYPGSSNKTNALDDVSFSIAAGELVVVVGANGSGKSTLVNILSRFYDPSSGQVLVDGVDFKDYKLRDIRESTATLTQDHALYPLSLKENIGLGFVENVTNNEMIEDSVRKGGAEQLVSKLSGGLDTILDPKTMQYSQYVIEGSGSPLAVKLQELKKKSNVSGGERQRLVAARTFMRFNSSKIKFVAIDEPTSALDPEGELALFTELRQARGGKTMMFITHRFGPLTKYADKIICMKEGKIVESGVHSELMGLKGEYFKMYSIQANAFESQGPVST